ncbi:uncharacterized protein JN550_005670 [Neoarthrinium moseri]|uniref:uncharacterized protein n=1 Tax=Neoarthrinium moseri TaxID=1658444 RepID=UPI001FDCCF0E|nr:uncharacterized protein JN550_005670 [Neoarthrinium moseri]KAI1869689.1 hypothetical protein JN550_005670 [Neoarthrinium moseri]
MLKIGALTATNFDAPLGPTVPTAWSLLPAPKPVPDFSRIVNRQSDPHWLPTHLSGEILDVTKRLLFLHPRGSHRVDDICDAWSGCIGCPDERMDATYLALMTDIIPSMSGTLLRNGGLYDAHRLFAEMEKWAEGHPGVPAPMTNSVAEAMQAMTHNQTVVLDIEFKRCVPKEGLEWVFTRTATKMLHEGRMDLDITICNAEMELVCTAHQIVMVLEAQRKFRRKKPEASL